MKPLIEAIHKIKPARGEVIVLQVDKIAPDDVRSFHSAFENVFPENKFVLLNDGCKLDFLSDEQLKAVGLMRIPNG